MSVYISVLKVKEYLGTKYPDRMVGGNESITYIYSYDFRPISHLSKFAEGFYFTEHVEQTLFLDLSYSTYNQFRQAICRMAHNVAPSFIWKLITIMQGRPFVEFINFADNEGCFDYVIAEKLYKDFSSYKEYAKETIPEFYDYYCTYMEILNAAVKCKGVVEYS